MSLEMGPLASYHCEVGECGIDFAKIGFTNGRAIATQTESGRNIRVSTSATRVSVYEASVIPRRTNYHMDIFVDGGILNPEIITWKDDAGYHPDFFAKEFVNATFAFFIANKLRIDGWSSWWPEGTRNYSEYFEAIDHRAEQIEAFGNTWSYKVAKKLGFSRILPKSIRRGDGIEVLFTR